MLVFLLGGSFTLVCCSLKPMAYSGHSSPLQYFKCFKAGDALSQLTSPYLFISLLYNMVRGWVGGKVHQLKEHGIPNTQNC